MAPPLRPDQRKNQSTVIATNTARAAPDRGGSRVAFTFSFDIVERLLKARDGKHAKLHFKSWQRLYLRFMTFTEYDEVPALFVYLDSYKFPGDKSDHPKLTKAKGRFTFHTNVASKVIGLRPDFKARRLKLLWVNKPAGLMLIFDDGDLGHLNK